MGPAGSTAKNEKSHQGIDKFKNLGKAAGKNVTRLSYEKSSSCPRTDKPRFTKSNFVSVLYSINL